MENVIKTDPYWASMYAWRVIKGPWPEAEDTIKTNPEATYHYARGALLKTPWPDAEPIILTYPDYTCLYARDVLKKRWAKAENTLRNSPKWACGYARFVIKGRWAEFNLAPKFKQLAEEGTHLLVLQLSTQHVKNVSKDSILSDGIAIAFYDA